MSVYSKFILILVLLTGFSGVVKADPIRIITGGSFVIPSQTQTSQATSDYRFEGTDLKGDGTLPFGFFPYTTLCPQNCNVIGSSFNLTSTFSTGTYMGIYPLGYSGRVQYLGNNYFVTQSQFSFITNDGILPPISSSANYTTATMNHSMNGTLILRSFSTNIPDLILNLSGSGKATIDYVANPNRSGLDIGFIRFNYADVFASITAYPTPEPTPEPTTILLLGTGLVGFAGYTRRKKRLRS